MASDDQQFAADNAYIQIVQNNSHLVAKLIPQAMARALEKIGLLAEGHVVGYMTKNHIVDTGRLRNSITHAIRSNNTVIVGTNVEYATYVHEGTSRMAGRPYLTAPIQSHLNEYREVLKSEMSGSGQAN